MINYDKNLDFQNKYLPYYGIGLFSTGMHELGHATVGTILGLKVEKIRLATPWMTGNCTFKTYPECLRTRAAIFLAGPIIGTATTIACIKWQDQANTNERNPIQNILCGYLLAKEIVNFVPAQGRDGHDVWWYLKSKFYKGKNEDLLKPRCGMLKAQLLYAGIGCACISFFDKNFLFNQIDFFKNIMHKK